jgi:hypothetical protein
LAFGGRRANWMADNACLVCFHSGRCDLEGAAKALTCLRLAVSRRDDELAVSYPGGPVLRVAYVREGYVAEEAAEIAQGNPHAAALLPCDARFEILIDDLDAVLHEYSTLFAVQEALEEATGGFLFNTWNGLFPGSVCNP